MEAPAIVNLTVTELAALLEQHSLMKSEIDSLKTSLAQC